MFPAKIDESANEVRIYLPVYFSTIHLFPRHDVLYSIYLLKSLQKSSVVKAPSVTECSDIVTQVLARMEFIPGQHQCSPLVRLASVCGHLTMVLDVAQWNEKVFAHWMHSEAATVAVDLAKV